MTQHPDSHDGSTLLPEESAHRILARAVELDAAQASDIPLTRLREIAHEAGIGTAAFEQAMREFQAPVASAQSQSDPEGESLWIRVEPVVRNVGAFAVAMAIIGASDRLAVPPGSGWPIEHAAAILGNILGVGLAVKLRARITAYVLGVTAIAQLAEYPMHLWFGIETVQGGPTKLALILAAALGLGVGILARRRARPSPAAAEAIDLNAEKLQADPRTQAEQSRALVLRPI
jgi:hypothetical protein